MIQAELSAIRKVTINGLWELSGARERRPPSTTARRESNKRIGGPARHSHASSKSLREAGLKKLCELRCCPELRDGIQFFECRRERIGQTPDRSRPELFVLRLEVEIVDGGGKMFGSFQSALDERFVDDHLGSFA